MSDPFVEKQYSEITRADVLDLCLKLLAKNAPATLNKVIVFVKMIFREALYREEINTDLTAGVRKIKERKNELCFSPLHS